VSITKKVNDTYIVIIVQHPNYKLITQITIMSGKRICLHPMPKIVTLRCCS